jgi:twitching motility protein PilT
MNINDMLKLIISKNASDLHLTVGIPPVLRIDGFLVYMDLPSLTRNDTEMAAKHLLGEEKKLRFDSSGEADASYVIPGQGLFRVNCYR